MNTILISCIFALHTQWKQPSQNSSSATGHIDNPKIAWEFDPRGREYLWSGFLKKGQFSPSLTENLRPFSRESERYWGIISPKLDVSGNGQLIDPPAAPGERWGKFLADVSGIQRLSWTTTWGKDANFQLHSFENGIDYPKKIWDIEFSGDIYSPLVVVADIDKDENLEVVLSTWNGVIAYDLTSGVEKYRCTYRSEHGRQYGFFGAHINSSGQVYLVVIGDFAGHIGVLTVENGALINLWYKTFDTESTQGIDRRFTINTVGPSPVSDFNGDGSQEILMNVFNENNDSRWHMMAYDLETGQHKLDLPDVYLHGHAEIEQNNIPVLLTQHTSNRCVSTNGKIMIYRWDQQIWHHHNARWSIESLPDLPLERVTGALRGMESPVNGVLKGQKKNTVFFTTEKESKESLHALQINAKGQHTILCTIEASPQVKLSAVAVAEGNILIRTLSTHHKSVKLKTNGIQLSSVAKNYTTLSAPKPLVLTDQHGDYQIVMAEPLNSISAYQVTTDLTQPLRPIWRTPGRAMTTQSPQMEGLASGDIDQDGVDEVLFVREMPDGHSRLIALGLNGIKRWYYDFIDFNGRSPIWNECGTTRWAVGHFTNSDRLDVMVSNRRSIMHSDETVVINTRTNTVAWHRDILEMPNHTRGYGGGRYSIASMGEDQLDNIIQAYPAEFSIIDGRTGKQITTFNLGPVEGSNHWVIDGTPIVVNSEITIVTHPSMVIALQNKSDQTSILWRTEPNDGVNGFPSIGDVDGDGNIEIGLPGCQDGFRCVDLKTGYTKWSIDNSDSRVSNCVSVDINCDGIEEFIYGNGTQLRAVAKRANQKSPIIWQIDLPAPIEHLVVADIDGDSFFEILVGSSNGKIYCVKQG